VIEKEFACGGWSGYTGTGVGTRTLAMNNAHTSLITRAAWLLFAAASPLLGGDDRWTAEGLPRTGVCNRQAPVTRPSLADLPKSRLDRE